MPARASHNTPPDHGRWWIWTLILVAAQTPVSRLASTPLHCAAAPSPALVPSDTGQCGATIFPAGLAEMPNLGLGQHAALDLLLRLLEGLAHSGPASGADAVLAVVAVDAVVARELLWQEAA